jgi:transposase
LRARYAKHRSRRLFDIARTSSRTRATIRREIAKLVGVALLSRDSGTFRGRRFVQGWRASVRAILYMGALVATKRNAVIRAFYQRLLSAGSRKTLALVA